MDNNEIGLRRLEVLEKLMTMYSVGTGKESDHKNDKGEYELIGFIKASLKLLYEKTPNPVFEMPDKFIEEFFTCLFAHKASAQ